MAFSHKQSLIAPSLMCNMATANDSRVTAHQQKHCGLGDTEVNKLRACSVISLCVSVLTCCSGGGELRWEERMPAVKVKGERRRLMSISTLACLIRQGSSTLWHHISAPTYCLLIQYRQQTVPSEILQCRGRKWLIINIYRLLKWEIPSGRVEL